MGVGVPGAVEGGRGGGTRRMVVAGQRKKLVRGECGCGGGPVPMSRPKVRAWLGIPRRWKHGDERVKRWRGSMRPAPNGNGPTWMTLRRSWSRWASPPKSMRGSLSAWRWSANMCERRRTGTRRLQSGSGCGHRADAAAGRNAGDDRRVGRAEHRQDPRHAAVRAEARQARDKRRFGCTSTRRRTRASFNPAPCWRQRGPGRRSGGVAKTAWDVRAGDSHRSR